MVAMEYAIARHDAVGQRYGKKGREPYTYHLNKAVGCLLRYRDLIPAEDLPLVIAATWCHDVIEDTRQTYNDVKERVSEEVAEIVYALTEEKGKNRRERHNDKYYEGTSRS